MGERMGGDDDPVGHQLHQRHDRPREPALLQVAPPPVLLSLTAELARPSVSPASLAVNTATIATAGARKPLRSSTGTHGVYRVV